MYRIGFYVHHFSYRGTHDAIYNYAHFNEVLLGNKSYLFFFVPCINPDLFDRSAFLQTLERFPLYFYSSLAELTELCHKLEIDAMHILHSGTHEKTYELMMNHCPKDIPRLVHCVFDFYPEQIPQQYKEIGIFAGVSQTVGKPCVNHMVVIDSTFEDLRAELGIPNDATVFGRHGGPDCFDPLYVVYAVLEVAYKYPNIYFLFMPKPLSFGDVKLPSNIIFLAPTTDKVYKRKFINTCDAMIHAKAMGESFGLACMEFSAANKPVLTHRCVHEWQHNQHLLNLGDKAWLFHDQESCVNQMVTLATNRNHVRRQDWDVTAPFSPARVMAEFDEVFLKPMLKMKNSILSNQEGTNY